MTDDAATIEPQSDTRVAELLDARDRINGELAKLSPRPLYHCLRCGYSWHGYNIHRPPSACARCHTAAWDRPPSHRDARRPGDAPNPKWRENKGSERKTARLKAALAGEPLDVTAEINRVSIEHMQGLSEFIFGGLTPPPSSSGGLTPPPRIQLASQFAHRVEPEPLPEQISSHNDTVQHDGERAGEIISIRKNCEGGGSDPSSEESRSPKLEDRRGFDSPTVSTNSEEAVDAQDSEPAE